ncbi:MAG TPA: UDP-3-O-(3-hydroxymyristoyl)glucosamine N-acyltransferase, partial [Terracidiphilus sp.]|nr:UDP-3-O-(3-hydroxymyristoyl)glucosamine N-acyltransferase [Terracidiphilus sp.]
MTLGELINALGGRLVQGTAQYQIDGVSSAEMASPSDLVFAEDAPAVAKALDSLAGAVVLRPGHMAPSLSDKCLVEADQPRLWFALAAKLLRPVLPARGVHPTAVVGANAELADSVTVGPCAVVDEYARIGAGTRIEAGAVVGRGVRIGEFCRIYPGAVIYPGTELGNWVVVHAGAVLGSDGFGYVRDAASGAYTQFPQQGVLVIEDDVEIGANTTIDRGALKETRIRRGVKIDNLVHIGHNCDIGEDVVLAALTGISGSSSVGKGAVIAGQVGIGDHAHVGPGVILGGQAGVFSGAKAT